MMCKWQFAMLAVTGAVLVGSASMAWAADGTGKGAEAGVVTPGVVSPGDWLQIKALLKATDEEWTIIFPQLWHIGALREDLYVRLPVRAPASDGIFHGPMGGTSLQAPTMEAPPGGRARGGRAGGGAGPFDPKTAPGAVEAKGGLSGALRVLAVRAMVAMIVPDQGHPVQMVAGELESLLATPGVTEEQVREKVATVRAVRKKALKELEAAQKRLAPLLTVDQTAVLVDLGLLD